MAEEKDISPDRQVEILCQRPVEFDIGGKMYVMKPKGFDMAFWLQDKVIEVARQAEVNVKELLDSNKGAKSLWDGYRNMAEKARPQLKKLIPLMFEDEIPQAGAEMKLSDADVGRYVTMPQAADILKTYWKQNDLGEVLKNVRGPRT